jgi:hypothetical protein
MDNLSQKLHRLERDLMKLVRQVKKIQRENAEQSTNNFSRPRDYIATIYKDGETPKVTQEDNTRRERRTIQTIAKTAKEDKAIRVEKCQSKGLNYGRKPTQ